MDSIDDLIAGIGAEAEAAMSGFSPEVAPTPDLSFDTEQPPVTEPVSSEAAPAVDVAAAPASDPSPVPAPEPEPKTPTWESDDNPYFKQAAQYEAAMKLAAQRVQENQYAEEMAARQRLINDLPNMDPDRARQVVVALTAWDQQQAAARVKQVEAEYEPFVKELVVHKLGQKLSLTADERKELEKFTDPRQLDWAAHQLAESRKQREAELAEARKKIGELTLQVQARERASSGVDRVAVGSAAVTLQDTNSIDDIVANLNLGDWMRA